MRFGTSTSAILGSVIAFLLLACDGGSSGNQILPLVEARRLERGQVDPWEARVRLRVVRLQAARLVEHGLAAELHLAEPQPAEPQAAEPQAEPPPAAPAETDRPGSAE